MSSQLQVKLPRKLARELHIEAGDEYYWRRSDDDPDVLLLIPTEVVERRYHTGERLEASRRAVATELDEPHVSETEPPPTGG